MIDSAHLLIYLVGNIIRMYVCMSNSLWIKNQ